MQSTLLNYRHNSENFDISFAFLRIFFTKFCGPKTVRVFWTTLYKTLQLASTVVHRRRILPSRNGVTELTIKVIGRRKRELSGTMRDNDTVSIKYGHRIDVSTFVK